jgi:hypothetical protein
MVSELSGDQALVKERIARLVRALADMQSSAPRLTEGADARGAVHVVLGADGLPESFRVARDWNRRVAASAFGTAVLEAFNVAARERVEVWSRTLDSQGWPARLGQLRIELDAVLPDPDPGSRSPGLGDAAGPALPAAFVRGGVMAQPPEEMAEEAIRVFDSVDEVAASPASVGPQGVGRNRGGSLVITLSRAALVSCRVDPQWLPGKDAASVATALGQALGQARARLADSVRAAGAGAARRSENLDRIFDEAMALLNSSPDVPGYGGSTRHAG